MAGYRFDVRPLFSFKLPVVLLFVVLRAPAIFITAYGQQDVDIKCKDEDVLSWHPWWYDSYQETNGTLCNIQCPLNSVQHSVSFELYMQPG